MRLLSTVVEVSTVDFRDGSWEGAKNVDERIMSPVWISIERKKSEMDPAKCANGEFCGEVDDFPGGVWGGRDPDFGVIWQLTKGTMNQ